MTLSALFFGNGTEIVHWKDGPTTRGTFDIVSSCVITLILCAWTAVHLNIAPPGESWRPMLRKTGWLLLALLAPEMVAYTAWWVDPSIINIHTPCTGVEYGSSKSYANCSLGIKDKQRAWLYGKLTRRWVTQIHSNHQSVSRYMLVSSR